MSRIVWVGPPDELSQAVGRAGFTVSHVETGSLALGDTWGDAVVAAEVPQPALVPPGHPLVLCLPSEEIRRLPPELVQRASVLLIFPVNPATLVRELESLVLHNYDFSI